HLNLGEKKNERVEPAVLHQGRAKKHGACRPANNGVRFRGQNADRIFDFFLRGERLAARPRIRGEPNAKRFQIRIMFRTELFFWRDQRSWKFRVSDHTIKGRPSGREDNTPEYDAARDRMNSVSQRNQTGNAGDYQ